VATVKSFKTRLGLGLSLDDSMDVSLTVSPDDLADVETLFMIDPPVLYARASASFTGLLSQDHSRRRPTNSPITAELSSGDKPLKLAEI